jgi:hypothetical protein
MATQEALPGREIIPHRELLADECADASLHDAIVAATTKIEFERQPVGGYGISQ